MTKTRNVRFPPNNDVREQKAGRQNRSYRCDEPASDVETRGKGRERPHLGLIDTIHLKILNAFMTLQCWTNTAEAGGSGVVA